MTLKTNPKTWFITGCSSGFGRDLTERLIQNGENVFSTARNPQSSEVFKLDVNSKDQIQKAVEAAVRKFGRIDVLVNNAGYGQVGAIEEVSEQDIRANFETNVFGLIEVTRAVLPVMRKQKSGHIINLSSVAGVAALPGAGIYAGTKFAVEGISEALAGEVAPFGIRVTLLEPGSFRTEFATPTRSLQIAPYLADYDEVLAQTRKFYETIGGNQPGDPQKVVDAILQLVASENPPLRLVLGKVALARVYKKIEQYQKEMQEWKAVTEGADFPEKA